MRGALAAEDILTGDARLANLSMNTATPAPGCSAHWALHSPTAIGGDKAPALEAPHFGIFFRRVRHHSILSTVATSGDLAGRGIPQIGSAGGVVEVDHD